jgi:hypothetical protein
MNYLIIILGIVIIVILYYLIKYFFTKQPLVKEVHLSNNPSDISSNAIKNPNSILYSFGCWVYVNNFSNARLFSYTESNDNSLFSLQLGGFNGRYSNKPTLRAIIKGKNASNSNPEPVEVVISNNFPIQKWVHVLVSIDTTYIDSYLDGKLVISKPLVNQITNSPTTTPYLTFSPPRGFSQSPDIYLTKVTRWDRPLDPQSVWSEYSSGNGRPNRQRFAFGVFSKSDNTVNNYHIYSE